MIWLCPKPKGDIGLRLGGESGGAGESGWGTIETTVLEQQLKNEKKKN